MKRMSAQVWVVLLFFYTFSLKFFISCAHVPRDWLPFGSRFSAFKCDNFAWHGYIGYLEPLFSLSADSETTVLLEPAPSIVPRLPSLFLWRTAPSFSSRA